MFQNLRRRIFGVGPRDLEAGRMASLRQADSESPLYLPASRLTEAQIHGVGDSGDCWAAWRVDGDGEQWFKRVSGLHSPASEIHGEATLDDIPADEFGDDTEDLVADFLRNIGIIRSRYERGEMPDDFDDADDEFGEANDAE